MDFSAANTALWSPMIQLGIIAGLILLANILRQKVKAIRTSLMPIAVLAGFILLGIRYTGLLPLDVEFLEAVTYHAIALGFIALALRVPEKQTESGALKASKNGALIVATYLVQALVGFGVSFGVAYTVNPSFFKASGILLPMAYGQGPGQANNVGTTYEALGMDGGRSYALSLAAAGYLCACIIGVIYLNVLSRRNKVNRASDGNNVSGSVTIDTFQDNNEIPIAESVDKFSVQLALVIVVYLATYAFINGIVNLLEATAPGLAKTLGTLFWGFNFIIGSIIAGLFRNAFNRLRKVNLMHRQYQNNYLLSRISGVAFDFMIVAGIASINIEELSSSWLPFILMAILGGIVTFYFLLYMCKKMYPDYVYEGFFGMFGMLTGTISSGVLLLREIDPELKTPASNDLITGSSFGIAFGAPLLIIISFAAQSDLNAFISFGLLAVYFVLLMAYIFKLKNKNK